MIAKGDLVSIEYTLKLGDGTPVDSNEGKEPLVYEQGGQQILPALENAITNMAVDDSANVVLTPEDGYGVVNPEAFQQVELTAIPEDAREEGAMLTAQDPEGGTQTVRIHEVREDAIVVDFNHPLAGQELHFQVKLLGVQAKPAE